jgi:hypothetical protein
MFYINLRVLQLGCNFRRNMEGSSIKYTNIPILHVKSLISLHGIAAEVIILKVRF